MVFLRCHDVVELSACSCVAVCCYCEWGARECESKEYDSDTYESFVFVCPYTFQLHSIPNDFTLYVGYIENVPPSILKSVHVEKFRKHKL